MSDKLIGKDIAGILGSGIDPVTGEDFRGGADSERVYVVQLTEAERARALEETFENKWLCHKIFRARPEHPGRRAALERLYETAIAVDWPRSGLTGYGEFVKVLADIRNLEDKR